MDLTDIYVAIGEKIRELRISFGGKGITQVELARLVKTTANTISRWETGVYKPSVTDLELLARVFGIPISDMFPDTEPPSQLNALSTAMDGLEPADVQDLIGYARYKRAAASLRSRRVGVDF
jgi:transcriptional regulator with XRE-family HTH domain